MANYHRIVLAYLYNVIGIGKILMCDRLDYLAIETLKDHYVLDIYIYIYISV
jgi:hypothetical protein